ncbi:hypothetical protein [Halomonas saccharevitans]|uniref:DUF2730 family protein n=1 Tax=Halomonas saccharevitans TaxID=416872 RepID=A0A1I7AGD3_9GAMM|nr:hypothetical protein [Halomonas saccharevitans]SFT73987.1 hypothetical protein SAMN04487956_11762 [Halomonas saccharevitans]
MGESIDWTMARFFFDLVQVAGLVGVSVYAWWVNRTRATGQAIGEINERVDELERRVDGVDHDLRHRPGTKELRDLWRKLDETNQGLAHAASTNEALGKQLSLVHQHLLEQRK